MYRSMGHPKWGRKMLRAALEQVHGGQPQAKRELCSLPAVASDVSAHMMDFFKTSRTR